MAMSKRDARVAGLLYLLLALFTGPPFIYLTTAIIEPGNAAATADNIVANATLFRFAGGPVGPGHQPGCAELATKLDNQCKNQT